MAISDSYVVQYLLETTLTQPQGMRWEQTEGGFRAEIRGVAVEFDIVPSRTGDRLFLTLSYGGRRTCIAEPLDVGLLNSKYESEDQRNLAGLMRELIRGVARQCADRAADPAEPDGRAREVVLRRLLFDESSPGHPRVA